jgi:hypothetical protein
MSRPVQHSFSSLQTFEICPKKYFHEKVKKDYKQTRSDVGDYGLEAHKAFEVRLLRGKKLPMDLQHHEKNLAKIAAAPGEGMPEQKLAINTNFEPTGYFDDDVWLRSVVDYAKVNGPRCLIIDHKFGKMKEGFDQVELSTAVFSCYNTDVERYTTAYYWAKAKKLVAKRITVKDIPMIWEGFLPRFERINLAHKNSEFPAKPNGLCKRYCPVKSCPYNGG